MVSRWGPPTWCLFHTMCEKIKDDDNFKDFSGQLFYFIKRICRVLPCPDCSQHALTFLAKVNINGVRNKEDLKNIMFIFHNAVNRRKNKPPFSNLQLTDTYSNNDIIVVYNNFIKEFHTKGNMNLISEAFQRQLTIREFRKWFMTNIYKFSQP
jgi:hypothetical protein